MYNKFAKAVSIAILLFTIPSIIENGLKIKLPSGLIEGNYLINGKIYQKGQKKTGRLNILPVKILH